MKYKLNKEVYKSKLRSTKIEDKIKFHHYLVDILDVHNDHKALDLGCGHGHTLMYIAENLLQGEVIGVDIDEKVLAVAEKILSQKNLLDKVELIQGDLSKDLPFEKNSFDRIVSHNVLECIPDKIKFINNCYTLLKKDGILVISHSDFDTHVYNSSYDELTRNLVHNYSDTKQDWMETSDGMIGRRLNGIFKHTKFKRFTPLVYVMSNYKFQPLQYGFRIAQDIIKIARESNKFSDKEIEKWVNDLEMKDKNSEYFFSGNINLVIAKK